jgi:hypothetical protein
MTIFWDALKALRDAAKAKRAAKLAAPPDDITKVAKANNVVPLKPKRTGLLEAIAHAGDHDDAGKPTYSMPLVHTHNGGGSRAINLNDEFPQSLATYNWLRSQQR